MSYDAVFDALERELGQSSASGGGSGSGGGGGTLRPFLHPDMAAVFRRLSPRSAPREYLSTVAHNVLAEYRLFLQESSFTRYTLRLWPPQPADAAPGRACVLSAERIREPGARDAAGGGDAPEVLKDAALGELHHHVGVRCGRLVIASFNAKDARGLQLIEGAPWTGRRMSLDTDDDFLDLGYMGDAVNEHAAASMLLASTTPEPRLLASIADPVCRRAAAFRVPSAAGVGSVVPINALQRSVLDGMRHDVEAVQGAQRKRLVVSAFIVASLHFVRCSRDAAV
jgi:hypothetical protein